MNAIIDEDLPRSFSAVLSNFSFKSFSIRDIMQGATDREVYLYAQKKEAVLFSADLGFSNILNFPLGTHYGVCILRFPNEMPIETINNEVKLLLSKLVPSDYKGNLIILSPGKLRLRRYKKITH